MAEEPSSEPTGKNCGLRGDQGVTSQNWRQQRLSRCSFVLLSVRTIGYRGVLWRGGEGVSQPPLKDRAFSIFSDQNPPFELRAGKWGFDSDKGLFRQCLVIDKQCHRATSCGC